MKRKLIAKLSFMIALSAFILGCGTARFYVNKRELYSGPEDPLAAKIFFAGNIFPLRANGNVICWESGSHCYELIPGKSPQMGGVLYLPAVPTTLLLSLEYREGIVKGEPMGFEVKFLPEAGEEYLLQGERSVGGFVGCWIESKADKNFIAGRYSVFPRTLQGECTPAKCERFEEIFELNSTNTASKGGNAVEWRPPALFKIPKESLCTVAMQKCSP